MAEDASLRENGLRTISNGDCRFARGSRCSLARRAGGGTRLKIFEALSMGKAVVSTAIGAEGLPLIDGQHFLRANTATDFSSAVVSLLGDAGRRKKLGNAGRDLVRAQYSWSIVARE